MTEVKKILTPEEAHEVRLLAWGATAVTWRIMQEVSEATGITFEDIRGARKTRELVNVRRFIAAKAREQGASLTQIGRALNKDHTTVLEGLRKGVRP